MKKILFIAIFFILAGYVSAATKVAIVFDAGGKFDRSFNQSAYEGALKAKKDLKIDLKDVEPGDTAAVEEAFRTFAKQKFDLVLGIGFANAPGLEKVAKENPGVKFGIVDSVVDLPNVASLVFKEQEGSFLVGMMAAMRAREVDGKKVVGFIGGMDIPLIHKFEQGYIQGAKTVDSNVVVEVNYVGNTPTAWNDPAKANEIAKAQMNKGATVIYSAAGGSGNGLFDAIKEVNGTEPCLPNLKDCVYAIGVDSNQNYIVPGQILTSMTKRVDVAIYEVIKSVVNNKFKGGISVFGLAEDGVGYSYDRYNVSLVTKKMRSVIDKYKKDIINGKITVKSER